MAHMLIFSVDYVWEGCGMVWVWNYTTSAPMGSVKDQIRPALLELFQDSLTDAQHLQRVEHSEKNVEDTLTQSSVQTDDTSCIEGYGWTWEPERSRSQWAPEKKLCIIINIFIYSWYWSSSSILPCKRLSGNVLSFFSDSFVIICSCDSCISTCKGNNTGSIFRLFVMSIPSSLVWCAANHRLIILVVGNNLTLCNNCYWSPGLKLQRWGWAPPYAPLGTAPAGPGSCAGPCRWARHLRPQAVEGGIASESGRTGDLWLTNLLANSWSCK